MIWILDCSFSAVLFLPDEYSSKVRDFFTHLSKNNQLCVPSLWWYEITNVLIVAERRKRLNYSDVVKIVSLFEKLDMETDKPSGVSYSKEIYELAHLNKLSAYYAVYLDLAIRKDASLASLDKQLLEVAVNSGISIYGT